MIDELAGELIDGTGLGIMLRRRRESARYGTGVMQADLAGGADVKYPINEINRQGISSITPRCVALRYYRRIGASYPVVPGHGASTHRSGGTAHKDMVACHTSDVILSTMICGRKIVAQLCCIVRAYREREHPT